MSRNVVINIYRNPVEPEADPPTWCCMPQVSGMAVSVCLIIGFELGTLAAVNVLPDLDRFDPDMHFYVAVFSAGTAVELLINMVAAIALYMKGCRGLLLPWIFVNGVTFVIFCCTLLVPLAILWFFLVKNMVEIYRNDFNKTSIPPPTPLPNPMPPANYPGCFPHNQGMPMEELASQMPAPAECEPGPQPTQQWLPQQPQPPSYEVSQARHGAGAEPNRNRNRPGKTAPSNGPKTSKPPSKIPKVREAAADKNASKKPK